MMKNKLKYFYMTIAGFCFAYASVGYAGGVMAAAPEQSLITPYVGANVGYQWARYDYETNIAIDTILPNGTSDKLSNEHYDSAILGALAGIRFNIPNYDKIFLATQLGLDFYPGNYNYTNKDHGLPGTKGGFKFYTGLKQKLQTSLSVLFGYHITPTIMPYLIGGVTYNTFSVKCVHNFSDSEYTTDKENFGRFGWLAGIGAQYSFTQHLAARLEYNYQDYGDYSYKFTYINKSGNNTTAKNKVKFKGTNVVKANLIWYF